MDKRLNCNTILAVLVSSPVMSVVFVGNDVPDQNDSRSGG